MKKEVDEFTKQVSWDVVIADSKLRSGTNFTGNQRIAKGLDGYFLKSVPNDVNGNPFQNDTFTVGASIGRAMNAEGKRLPFYKIHSDGNGNYSDIIPKD